jgi:WD40 repeat protein
MSGSLDGTLKLWEPTGQLAHTFSGVGWHTGGVVCLALHPDGGPSVATGSDDGSVCVARLDSKKILSRFLHSDRAVEAASSSAGPEQAAQEEAADDVSVEAVAFCASHPWLASAGTDSRVILWDLVAGTRRAVLAHGGAVVAALWVPVRGEARLVTASADGQVRLWDARTASLLKGLTGHTDAILDMALSKDGKYVVSGGDDGVCRVFSLEL